MALPVSEQIVAKVRARLTGVTTGNGYETSASAVIRPKRIDTERPRDYRITVTQGTMQPNQALSHPGNPPALAYVLPVMVAGELRPSENDTTSIDTLRNVFAADVIKCICSPSNWWTWDQLAIDTSIGEVQAVNSENAAAFMMPVNVLFRVSENDPYTVRA